MLYTAKNTIELITNEFPDFKPYLEERMAGWKEGERTIGIDISTFLSFISGKLGKNENYNYKAVFGLIEKLLVEGDSDVRLAVELQFLESLLNCVDYGDYSIESFISYLGEESRKACKVNEEFWGVENNRFNEGSE